MRTYYRLLDNVDGLKVRKYADWCTPVHWLTTITLDEEYNRDGCIDYMRHQGIDCRQMINPVHHAVHFRDSYSDDDFPNTVAISRQSLHLPSSTNLTDDQLQLITEKIRLYINS
jgi:dTDP-4-amino-4,6-dideoxygalactose transaminase